MNSLQTSLNFGEVWIEMKDGNDTCRHIFDRHYSRYFYKDGRKPKLFVGPGQKMVLLTPCAKALFVWRKFIDASGQTGVNCAIFRNEGAGLSSSLINEADRLADIRWPMERHYTYVSQTKVQSSNPGYCFLKAGWKKCGITKTRKLLIFERLPFAANDNEPVRAVA